MGKLYAIAIINGTRTYDSIGALWKKKTYNALIDMVESGEITEEEFEEYVGEPYPTAE